jgi:hypothetical protein
MLEWLLDLLMTIWLSATRGTPRPDRNQPKEMR